MRAALADLSPRERELIALKFYGGLSNPEIARVLGVSESNAGTLLHRTITLERDDLLPLAPAMVTNHSHDTLTRPPMIVASPPV